MIELATAIEHLRQQAQIIKELVTEASIDLDFARWKPTPDSWSVLEVVNHLADEERDDFRTRLKHILDRAEGLPPPIDPQGWVTERRYNERDLNESITRFMQERAESLAWLRTLNDVDWNTAIDTPFGRLHAGDMLMAWIAHDMLHLRQLIELRYAIHKQQAQPYQIDYAGDW